MKVEPRHLLLLTIYNLCIDSVNCWLRASLVFKCWDVIHVDARRHVSPHQSTSVRRYVMTLLDSLQVSASKHTIVFFLALIMYFI